VAYAIRTYRPGDEASLAELWNRSLPLDTIAPRLLYAKVFADPNFDPAGLLLAEDGGRLVGFLLALVRRLPLSGVDLEPAEGWITAFAVHPDHRRRGLGSQLLAAGLAFLRERGRVRVRVSPYAPNYFWPGVDRQAHAAALALLERHGLRVLYEAVAMDRRLTDFAVPEDVAALRAQREAEGYRFHHLAPCWLVPLIAFNERHFHPDWTRAVREAVARGGPYDHFLLCTRGDELCGFAMYGLYDHVADRFGPFGVRPDLRRLGLGKVLLYTCLDEMRQHGFHDAWFLWTGEREPAGQLYRRAGFEITRRFAVMGREL
jgi:mycothiol synthase